MEEDEATVQRACEVAAAGGVRRMAPGQVPGIAPQGGPVACGLWRVRCAVSGGVRCDFAMWRL